MSPSPAAPSPPRPLTTGAISALWHITPRTVQRIKRDAPADSPPPWHDPAQLRDWLRLHYLAPQAPLPEWVLTDPEALQGGVGVPPACAPSRVAPPPSVPASASSASFCSNAAAPASAPLSPSAHAPVSALTVAQQIVASRQADLAAAEAEPDPTRRQDRVARAQQQLQRAVDQLHRIEGNEQAIADLAEKLATEREAEWLAHAILYRDQLKETLSLSREQLMKALSDPITWHRAVTDVMDEAARRHLHALGYPMAA